MPTAPILRERKRGPMSLASGPDVGARHNKNVAASINYIGPPRKTPDSHFLEVQVPRAPKQEVKAYVERTENGIKIRLKTRKGMFGGRIPQGVVPVMHSWVRDSGFEHPLEIKDLQDEGVEMHYSLQ